MKKVKLGSVIKIIKGKKAISVFDTQNDNRVRFIQIDDLRNDNNLKYTVNNGILAKFDDIIIAWDGANAGTIGYGLNGIIGSTLAKIEIQDSEINAKFFGKFLQSKSRYLRDKCTGATIPHISKQVLENLQIPLPPLEDQKRIVNILDEADALRQKRKQAIGLLDDYLKSVFLEMFGDTTRNVHNFPCGKIEDLVCEVKYGTSKKSEDHGDFPYLRMNNLTYSGELDISNLKYINLTKDEESKYLAKNGDLLFNRTNSKELVGKTVVYNLDYPMAIAGYLIRVRTGKNGLPEYISGYLNSKHGKLTLKNMCKSIVGMANINAKELQKIKILIPPMNLQVRYKSILQKTSHLKQSMLNQSVELETQFQALMQKAFKGEL